MAKPYKLLRDKMSPESRARAKVKAEKLRAELPLQEVRHALELTQQQLADKLNMNQASLSKLEKRTDMLLSTLRRYLNAMGADLELKAKFPDGKEVIITQLEGLQENSVVNHSI
ncbi:hypothetical protein MNBD_GAMMA22-2233 [hydrothermal vent metagenome]|uniref:HTH cro/C1-type domain-containing protein n=1 Tax=hydrothermal vent metagenome TaxID=652676 RepID=A0A3B1ACD8_9ZZZZ